MLSSTVSLAADAGERYGRIGDVEKFSNDALNDYLNPRGGYIHGDARCELLAKIFLVCVRCAREYDPLKANGLAFTTYAYRTIHLRITDHYRKLGGDRRYGPRPVEESLEERLDELAGTDELELLDGLDTTGLTPESRMTLKKLVRPMLELGLTKDEAETHFGWSRREVNGKLDGLRCELLAMRTTAAA